MRNSNPKNELGQRSMPDRQAISKLNKSDKVNFEVQLGDVVSALAERELPFVFTDPGDGNTLKAFWKAKYPFRILSVSCSIDDCPTSVAFDVKDDGVSVLTEALTIDENETVALADLDPALINVATDSKMSFEVTQTGVGTGVVPTMVVCVQRL